MADPCEERRSVFILVAMRYEHHAGSDRPFIGRHRSVCTRWLASLQKMECKTDHVAGFYQQRQQERVADFRSAVGYHQSKSIGKENSERQKQALRSVFLHGY